MDRVPGQPYPGSDYTASFSFVPSLHVSRLYDSPNAVQFAWYQAFPDPSYNKQSGQSDSRDGRTEFVRELQPGTFRCIWSESPTVVKRYLPQGTWDMGTVAIGFDPAQSPLSIFDWIVPMSQDGLFPPSTALPTGLPLLPTPQAPGRIYTQKETVQRGSTRLSGAGTISTLGSAVTGAGTAFTKFFQVGDTFFVSAFAARVTSVADDTRLTLDAAPAHDFTGIGYALGRDTLSYSPVTNVSKINSISKDFVNGVDFVVVSGFPQTLVGDYIQWLSPVNSPAPGETYGVSYNYLPRYELTGYGTPGAVVGGQSMLSHQVATLWKPQTSPNI